MSDERIIKSYVWHGDECFFVSTIERDCSAPIWPHRYNETLVWRYDWEKGERSERFVFQSEDTAGQIEKHVAICRELLTRGIDGLLSSEKGHE